MATDYDCWRDTGEPVSVPDVLKTFKENAQKVTKLFEYVVPKIAQRSWKAELTALEVSEITVIFWEQEGGEGEVVVQNS